MKMKIVGKYNKTIQFKIELNMFHIMFTSPLFLIKNKKTVKVGQALGMVVRPLPLSRLLTKTLR